MERAARLIKNKRVSRELLTDEEIACAVWRRAVGEAIARHTSRLKLVRNNLVVEVEDAIWQRQLHSLSRQIIARIQKLTGSDAVQDIEFRIGIPRREPGREERPTTNIAAEQCDEADRIQDPVLRHLYRVSRKKATG
jgi:predicted nucleic acid-binding Zn ribbon protein